MLYIVLECGRLARDVKGWQAGVSPLEASWRAGRPEFRPRRQAGGLAGQSFSLGGKLAGCRLVRLHGHLNLPVCTRLAVAERLRSPWAIGLCNLSWSEPHLPKADIPPI